ncbi:MAG: helix-turn-helix domain-containing protein [Dethiobacter sp.]|jgi:transposase-like protein|nr:MAG: helix-turn-helix domain-containing protein [Dethiobacter sp.]
MKSGRYHSPEKKLRVVKESQETGNATLVACRYELSPSKVNRWVREYRKYGEAAFNGKPKGKSFKGNPYGTENQKLAAEKKLKKILGEKDLEIAILRNLLKKLHLSRTEKIEVAKKWISLARISR